MISRRVLDKIGALDPQFWGYFADLDLGIRTRIAGYNLVLARGAFALHMKSANFDYLPAKERQMKLNLRWMRVYENWARFKLKYGMPVEQIYPCVYQHFINDIKWDDLSTAEYDADKHYFKRGDYSKFFL